MNVEEFREYCLSFKGVQEKMPFLDVADQYSRMCFASMSGANGFVLST